MRQVNLHAAFVPADEHLARQGNGLQLLGRWWGSIRAGGSGHYRHQGLGRDTRRAGDPVGLARRRCSGGRLPGEEDKRATARLQQILVRQGSGLADRLAVVIRRTGARQGLDVMLSFDADNAELLARTTQIENGQISRFAATNHERGAAEQRVQFLGRWIEEPGVRRFGDCGSPTAGDRMEVNSCSRV